METETIIDLALEFDKINEVMNLSEHFVKGDLLMHSEQGSEENEVYDCTNIEDLKRYYINVIGNNVSTSSWERVNRISIFITEVYNLKFSTFAAEHFFIDIIAESINNQITELN